MQLMDVSHEPEVKGNTPSLPRYEPKREDGLSVLPTVDGLYCLYYTDLLLDDLRRMGAELSLAHQELLTARKKADEATAEKLAGHLKQMTEQYRKTLKGMQTALAETEEYLAWGILGELREHERGQLLCELRRQAKEHEATLTKEQNTPPQTTASALRHVCSIVEGIQEKSGKTWKSDPLGPRDEQAVRDIVRTLHILQAPHRLFKNLEEQLSQPEPDVQSVVSTFRSAETELNQLLQSQERRLSPKDLSNLRSLVLPLQIMIPEDRALIARFANSSFLSRVKPPVFNQERWYRGMYSVEHREIVAFLKTSEELNRILLKLQASEKTQNPAGAITTAVGEVGNLLGRLRTEAKKDPLTYIRLEKRIELLLAKLCSHVRSIPNAQQTIGRTLTGLENVVTGSIGRYAEVQGALSDPQSDFNALMSELKELEAKNPTVSEIGFIRKKVEEIGADTALVVEEEKRRQAAESLVSIYQDAEQAINTAVISDQLIDRIVDQVNAELPAQQKFSAEELKAFKHKYSDVLRTETREGLTDRLENEIYSAVSAEIHAQNNQKGPDSTSAPEEQATPEATKDQQQDKKQGIAFTPRFAARHVFPVRSCDTGAKYLPADLTPVESLTIIAYGSHLAEKLQNIRQQMEKLTAAEESVQYSTLAEMRKALGPLHQVLKQECSDVLEKTLDSIKDPTRNQQFRAYLLELAEAKKDPIPSYGARPSLEEALFTEEKLGPLPDDLPALTDELRTEFQNIASPMLRELGLVHPFTQWVGELHNCYPSYMSPLRHVAQQVHDAAAVAEEMNNAALSSLSSQAREELINRIKNGEELPLLLSQETENLNLQQARDNVIEVLQAATKAEDEQEKKPNNLPKPPHGFDSLRGLYLMASADQQLEQLEAALLRLKKEADNNPGSDKQEELDGAAAHIRLQYLDLVQRRRGDMESVQSELIHRRLDSDEPETKEHIRGYCLQWNRENADQLRAYLRNPRAFEQPFPNYLLGALGPREGFGLSVEAENSDGHPLINELALVAQPLQGPIQTLSWYEHCLFDISKSLDTSLEDLSEARSQLKTYLSEQLARYSPEDLARLKALVPAALEVYPDQKIEMQTVMEFSDFLKSVEARPSLNYQAMTGQLSGRNAAIISLLETHEYLSRIAAPLEKGEDSIDCSAPGATGLSNVIALLECFKDKARTDSSAALASQKGLEALVCQLRYHVWDNKEALALIKSYADDLYDMALDEVGDLAMEPDALERHDSEYQLLVSNLRRLEQDNPNVEVVPAILGKVQKIGDKVQEILGEEQERDMFCKEEIADRVVKQLERTAKGLDEPVDIHELPKLVEDLRQRASKRLLERVLEEERLTSALVSAARGIIYLAETGSVADSR